MATAGVPDPSWPWPPVLSDAPWSGHVQPLPMGVACALLLIAALSANASACFLVYSPTKLQRLLGPERGPQLAEFLRASQGEFRVLIRLLTFSTACGGLVLAGSSVSGPLGHSLFGFVCLLLALTMVVLPPALSRRNPERVVVASLGVLRPLRLLFRCPVLLPLIWLSRPLLRALRISEQPTTDPDEITDEILAAVEDTQGGTLAEEERTWIGNIVELKELHASEVMTPRTDIHALDGGLPLGEAVRLAVEHGHSRFPVYCESIDDVVGVFYAKDVLGRLAHRHDVDSITVGELTREPLFAPESMRISELLKEFQKSKVQMAIVVDEYGGTAGLITIEDILEEIVGEIEDEFDPEAEAPITIVEPDHVIEVSGKTRVEEANEALGTDMVPEGDDYDTVAGFVFSHLGQIPEVGTVFQSAGVEFEVLAADHRRVSRVRLTLLSTQPTDS